jgi:hypothetical protein
VASSQRFHGQAGVIAIRSVRTFVEYVRGNLPTGFRGLETAMRVREQARATGGIWRNFTPEGDQNQADSRASRMANSGWPATTNKSQNIFF